MTTRKNRVVIFACLILVVALLHGGAFAESSDSTDDRVAVRLVYNAVIKNMIGYIQYKYLQEHVRQFASGHFDASIFVGEDMQLDTGSYYLADVRRVAGVECRDTSWTFYSFAFPIRRYGVWKCDAVSGRCTRKIALAPIDYLFPPLTKNGLVAIGRDGSVYFVSGYMFLHDVRREFFDEKPSAEEVSNYVTARYFNYMPRSIHVDESLESAEFYSACLNKRVRVHLCLSCATLIGETVEVLD